MAQNKDKIFKGILAGITGFIDGQANRQKLTAQLMMNEMKLKQNWMYKLQEAQQKQQMEREQSQWLMDEYQRRFGGTQGNMTGLKETTPAQTGQSFGPAEGGQVLATEGEQNEYLPGYEPKPIETAPAKYDIDEAALMNPQARQQVTMTPTGKLSVKETPYAQAYYQRLLQLEKKQGLNPQQQAMKERLENRLLGKIKEEKPTNYSSETTQKVISNIKTEDDFNDLLKNKAAYKEAGVDIGEVVKSFINNPQIKQSNPSLFKKIMSFITGG